MRRSSGISFGNALIVGDGRKWKRQAAYYGAGLLEEGLKWISGGNEFQVVETRCIAKGDEVCEYSINKDPIITHAS